MENVSTRFSSAVSALHETPSRRRMTRVRTGMAKSRESYIPASVHLPEVTLKATILSVILSVVLGAANAYLGLFAGMTVSASIPSAVVSMAIFRFFKTSNILENNIVQTVASAGESIAGGVIFTIPALLILGTWTQFNYWEPTFIASLRA